MKRLLTGVVLAAATLFGVLFAPSWLVWIVIVGLAVIGAAEMRRFVGAGKDEGPAAAVAVVTAPLLAFGLGSGSWPGPWLAVGVALALFSLVGLAALVTPSVALGAAARGSLLSVYLGVTVGAMGAVYGMTTLDGRHVLLVGIAAVYSGDTAAYYGGRRFGRRKLAPSVSPGKTLEGAMFGLAASGVACALASAALLDVVDAATAFGAGVALGMAGITGDLVESAMKRRAGIKDSGALLPGHGGILDRIDSFLLAAPLLYLFARLLSVASR